MAERDNTLRQIFPEQDRFIQAIAEARDDPRQVVLAFSEAAAVTGALSFAPGQKAEILKVELVNGDVAIAASSTTTALDVDIVDGAGSKTHDLVAKAANVAVAADAKLDMGTAALLADRTVEATEMVKCLRTIASTQGEMSLVISYKFID